MSILFTCKQVSKHLAKEDYEKLPLSTKLSLKFHVLICPVCGAYNRQVMKFQDMVRTLRARQDQKLEEDTPDAPRLAEEKRRKLKDALRQAAGKDT